MSPWPTGFPTVRDEPWAKQALGDLARKYDSVQEHGWYDNLDPTIDRLADMLDEGDLMIDYSGGTGILADRLLKRMATKQVGVLIVDSSPKFLRLALEKLGDDPRLAFRLIRYLKEERRLELVDEVLEDALKDRGVDVLTSTNAVHLYYDLDETLASWRRVVRPGGRVHVQSGNIRNPNAPEHAWIIDETVEHLHRQAIEIVQADDRWASYRSVVADTARMERYDALRRKYFLPVRPLDHYTGALERAGFELEEVACRPIQARSDEWFQFLGAYHEGVLGWVGGVEKIEGTAADDAAVTDRLALMQRALDVVLGDGGIFEAAWTYITAARPSAGLA